MREYGSEAVAQGWVPRSRAKILRQDRSGEGRSGSDAARGPAVDVDVGPGGGVILDGIVAASAALVVDVDEDAGL